ncbi:MAG TPA: hypothetical protein VFS08_20410 [Gemmatimonadaceae bacterium]|nr:hypothetical protein [Gemmatimonadaceae bacterium]
MAIWDKLKTELDRAGRAAQSAFDEGKARLEILRVRQLADKAAQALGYAVYNARKAGGELDAETYARLSSTLAAHEAEAQRLEGQLDAARAGQTGTSGTTTSAGGAGTTGGSTGTGPDTASGAETARPVDPAMGDSGGATANPYQGGGTPGI